MINIRYHIVSITAVFLALGIGVALGSTFLDRATVNLLDRNISSAEKRIKETKADNERLSHEVSDAQERDSSLIQNGGQVGAGGGLKDVPVVIVEASGVDQTTLTGVQSVLSHSGADVRGTLQLRKGMRFQDDLDADLASSLGVGATHHRTARRVVDAKVIAALVAAARKPATTHSSGHGGGTTTTTTAVPGAATTTTAPGATTTTSTTTTVPAKGATKGTTPEIISSLIDAGYLRLTPGPTHAATDPILEPAGYRFVFVSQPGLDPADDAALIDLLPSGSDGATIPAVVVSSSVPDTAGTGADAPTPSAVSTIRTSALLAGLYTTVDDVDTYSGLVAMAQALEQVGTVAPGHYGQGEGATSVLPPAP